MANILRVFFVFFIPFVFADVIKGKLVTGVLEETAELIPKVDCAEIHLTRTLTRRLVNGTILTVARRVGGVWTGEGDYKNRVENSTSGVSLKNLNYNDKGNYEFSCDDYMIELHVDIITNNNLSVFIHGNVTLSFFSLTLGENVESVLWVVNNKTVLKLNFSDGRLEYGAGFEERVFLSPEWKSNGDLSLTLVSVRLEDQGDYLCLVVKHGGKVRGDPAVNRLTVLPPLTPATTPVSTNSSTTCPKSEENPLLWTLIPVGVVLGILGTLLVQFCPACRRRRHGVGETPEQIPLNGIPRPQINGGGVELQSVDM